jgi:hypothetical protein
VIIGDEHIGFFFFFLVLEAGVGRDATGSILQSSKIDDHA